MIFWQFGVYENVVNEDNDELVKIGFEHSIHEVHESYWDICDAKRYDEKLVVPVTGFEGSIFNAFHFEF